MYVLIWSFWSTLEAPHIIEFVLRWCHLKVKTTTFIFLFMIVNDCTNCTNDYYWLSKVEIVMLQLHKRNPAHFWSNCQRSYWHEGHYKLWDHHPTTETYRSTTKNQNFTVILIRNCHQSPVNTDHAVTAAAHKRLRFSETVTLDKWFVIHVH